MLKKYDADELKPYAEKLKQMAIDKLVSTFDVSDISFQSLTTSSGIGDATTHTLLCPNCHNQFTVTLNSDRYSYPSPICPHCGPCSSSGTRSCPDTGCRAAAGSPSAPSWRDTARNNSRRTRSRPAH